MAEMSDAKRGEAFAVEAAVIGEISLDGRRLRLFKSVSFSPSISAMGSRLGNPLSIGDYDRCQGEALQHCPAGFQLTRSAWYVNRMSHCRALNESAICSVRPTVP